MWILFVAAMVVCAICEGVAYSTYKNDVLNKEERILAVVVITVEVAVGILLCWIVEFGIQFYDSTDIDFWNYGKITSEGILYFGMKLCGAISIASAAILAGAIAVKDIRNALVKSVESLQGNKATDANENKSEAEDPWKIVTDR